jgi:hypothetical protein
MAEKHTTRAALAADSGVADTHISLARGYEEMAATLEALVRYPPSTLNPP